MQHTYFKYISHVSNTCKIYVKFTFFTRDTYLSLLCHTQKLVGCLGKLQSSISFFQLSLSWSLTESGLVYKINTNLPRYFLLSKSKLYDGRFYVRNGHDISESHSIKSGVPQGSMLRPMIYILYAVDLPKRRDVTVVTYADDILVWKKSIGKY